MKFGYIFATGMSIISLGLIVVAFNESILGGLVYSFILGSLLYMTWDVTLNT